LIEGIGIILPDGVLIHINRNHPGWQGGVPYLLATVKLPEGPRITAEVVDCPEGAIKTERDEITGHPYIIDVSMCKGCLNCVFVCPGLATTLVDFRKDKNQPIVTLPYEIWREKVEVGEKVAVTDVDGAILGYYPVEKVLSSKKKYPGTLLVQVRVGKGVAKEAAGIWVQEAQVEPSLIYEKELPPDEAIICRCERVTAGEVRKAIMEGVRDINQLKAITRAGMGACGSKTCRPMIGRLFEEEGIDLGEVTDRTDRPLYVEVPLGILAGVRSGGEE